MEERIFAIAHYVDQGVLYLLIVLSLASVLMIAERLVRLGKQGRSSRRFLHAVEDSLGAGKLEDLEAFSPSADSVEGRALRLGVQHLRIAGTNGLEEAFNTFTMVEKPRLERYLNFLATVGANAPYIGLFGTVLGIMKAFREMAGASEGGQQAVMAGISGALIATAAGLMVAIPSVIAFNYFQKEVKAILQGVEAARELCLGYGKRRGT